MNAGSFLPMTPAAFDNSLCAPLRSLLLPLVTPTAARSFGSVLLGDDHSATTPWRVIYYAIDTNIAIGVFPLFLLGGTPVDVDPMPSTYILPALHLLCLIHILLPLCAYTLPAVVLLCLPAYILCIMGGGAILCLPAYALCGPSTYTTTTTHFPSLPAIPSLLPFLPFNTIYSLFIIPLDAVHYDIFRGEYLCMCTILEVLLPYILL